MIYGIVIDQIRMKKMCITNDIQYFMNINSKLSIPSFC